MTLNISSSVTDAQLGAYYRKTAAIADRLGKSLSHEDVMVALQRIHDNDFSAPFPKQESAKKKSAKSVLTLCDEEIIVGPLKIKFVRREFFKTRQGLYLWNDMERVLSATQDAEPTETSVKFSSFDLTKNAYDREIKGNLPAKHEVELWQIAELIERQRNGEDGSLLTNGYANIFYVAGFAVHVRWDSGERGWRVYGWRLDGNRWGEGRRVFSSN